eukprot:13259456-Heterocapsa_arctica.AAC.1
MQNVSVCKSACANKTEPLKSTTDALSSASRFLWLYVASALAGSPGSTPVSGGSVASARTNL